MEIVRVGTLCQEELPYTLKSHIVSIISPSRTDDR